MDTTFSYDQIESALASVFSVPDDKRKALRARLRHFTNLGLAPEGRPGKGKRIRYTFEDAVRWTVALELAHFGFNPQDIVEFLQKTRGSFRRVIWLMLRDITGGGLGRNMVAVIKVAPLFDEFGSEDPHNIHPAGSAELRHRHSSSRCHVLYIRVHCSSAPTSQQNLPGKAAWAYARLTRRSRCECGGRPVGGRAGSTVSRPAARSAQDCMPRPLPFTEHSLTRAIRAARKAGLRVSGIKPDGTLIVGDNLTVAPSSVDVQNTAHDRWGDVEA